VPAHVVIALVISQHNYEVGSLACRQCWDAHPLGLCLWQRCGTGEVCTQHGSDTVSIEGAGLHSVIAGNLHMPQGLQLHVSTTRHWGRVL
jgi:hypothetical protein